MPKFKLNPRQIRNLMVTVLLSFVVALPLLSQPLGLSFAWNYPTVDADADTGSEGLEDTSYTLEPVDTIDNAGQLFNRSKDLIEMTTETTPAILDDEEVDPSDTEPAETTETVTEPTDPPYVAVDYILYISANSLNLRAEPSTDAEILAELEFGDKVSCTGENDQWMQVTYEGKSGYVKTEYTSKTMVFESVKQTVYVSSSKLNLRESPTTSSDVLVSLSHLQKLTRTGIGDGWSKVKTSTGKVGYVASQYVTTKAPSVSSGTTVGNAPANSSGNRIVDLAQSALGVRYVFGSASMNGFDCSGLVYWCYRQIGVTVPRTSTSFSKAGIAISYSDIQPGDILCMDTRRSDGITSITHVGIYVGGGKMIHASSTKGKVVVQDVSQYLKWGIKLITVRRFPN